MARFPRFSTSFILVAAILTLFLSARAVAASSDKDGKQAENLAERDEEEEKTIPDARILNPDEDKKRRMRFEPSALDVTLKEVISATVQAPFTFCQIDQNGNFITTDKSKPCAVPFRTPFNSANGQLGHVTPVLLPFANPANNFQQCWGAKPAPWQCGSPNPVGGDYGNYPNSYVGAYIDFPTGSLPALQADVKSTGAQESIVAVMEEFVYNVVTNMLGLGTSMTARCGFPNQMVFGCLYLDKGKWVQAKKKNNPQLYFGVAPDGRVRLLIIFMVDWNVIISKGRIKTFAQYESTVKSFFTTTTVAKLWDASLRTVGPGRSQFLGGGSRRALEEETGEEQEEEEQKEGSLRKLPAVKRPPPKVTGSGVVKVMTAGSSK